MDMCELGNAFAAVIKNMRNKRNDSWKHI